MKKIFSILILALIFFNLNYLNANANQYEVNDIVENQFYLNKNLLVDLPGGKWTVAWKNIENHYNFKAREFRLIKLENNKAIEFLELTEVGTVGADDIDVREAIDELVFKNKYDGCYERPEYSILKFYKKGTIYNCFIANHLDANKEILTPEDPEEQKNGARYRKWIKDNQIELPKVILRSWHSYFSMKNKRTIYLIIYGIDPKILNAPENKFITEETSEYHKNNIANYPEHEKIMKNWISISAQRHIEFEKLIEAPSEQKLDLADLLPAGDEL